MIKFTFVCIYLMKILSRYEKLPSSLYVTKNFILKSFYIHCLRFLFQFVVVRNHSLQYFFISFIHHIQSYIFGIYVLITPFITLIFGIHDSFYIGKLILNIFFFLFLKWLITLQTSILIIFKINHTIIDKS